ncbi:MAG: chromate resistance protein ChrB domain-containing protein [Pikeienuella sp.]
MPAPDTITVSQLSRLIGTPDAPVLIDISIDADFDDDPFLIPGAFRHPFTDIEGLVPRLTGRRVVVICQKGIKLSQGGAALLRTHGVRAEVLEGGNFGWRDAGGPRLPAAKLPAGPRGGSLWVTRHRPKIDRIACPWLIRRFIDPAARFLFVSPAEVQGVADRYNATPFDMEGVYWSHREDLCTFDVMVGEFGLTLPALSRLAMIVRAADTNRHDLAPEAAGLMAASLGLSRMYRDDLQQLEAGMTLYDAFYRWARDATDETHDWPATWGA